jgi:4'-phosphopantetheinyl transferase
MTKIPAIAERGDNQIDIWRINLATCSRTSEEWRTLLAPDEVAHADRYYFEQHRCRFTVARAAMRQILSCYAAVAPREIVFRYGTRGKPELSGKLRGITFNMSHSNEAALFAVTRRSALGVDIELVNREIRFAEIARGFFSATEVRCLEMLPPGERADAFFSCWTRKEAYIKAVGEGLSIPLRNFDVAFGPSIPAALLAVRGRSGERERWRMYDIEAPEGYKAALVAEGKAHQIHYWHWNPEEFP